MEMRRADCNAYPLASISNVLAGLYQVASSGLSIDRKTHHFHELTSALQVQYKQLRHVFGSLFSGLNDCQISVYPQNMVVNIGHPVSPSSADPVSNLLDGNTLEQLLD